MHRQHAVDQQHAGHGVAVLAGNEEEHVHGDRGDHDGQRHRNGPFSQVKQQPQQPQGADQGEVQGRKRPQKAGVLPDTIKADVVRRFDAVEGVGELFQPQPGRVQRVARHPAEPLAEPVAGGSRGREVPARASFGLQDVVPGFVDRFSAPQPGRFRVEPRCPGVVAHVEVHPCGVGGQHQPGIVLVVADHGREHGEQRTDQQQQAEPQQMLPALEREKQDHHRHQQQRRGTRQGGQADREPGEQGEGGAGQTVFQLQQGPGGHGQEENQRGGEVDRVEIERGGIQGVEQARCQADRGGGHAAQGEPDEHQQGQTTYSHLKVKDTR